MLEPELIAHEKSMRIGSASLLKAIYAMKVGRGPEPSRAFVWARMGLTRTINKTVERDRSVAQAHIEQREAINERRVSRGVCINCGTRTDIGCKHRRAA